jgi:methylated-DNA-protein-cysteine methyltransferase-like protein
MIPNDELWSLIGRIPRGKVTSYGEVGKALHNPASGYFVGRWMTNCPPDVPWWRVVGKNGAILLGKRSPELAAEQESRLKKEGINVEGGLVDKTAFIYSEDLLER